MIRTYKYRIYPNKTHKAILDDIFQCQCTLYNQALHHRIEHYKKTQKSISYPDQWKVFKPARKELFPTVNATSFQQLLRRLDKAYKAFFRRIKSGEKAGFPRFKPIQRFNAIEFKPGDGCRIKHNKLNITHVGQIRIKMHREIPIDSKIKHIVVTRNQDKWYVCFQIEIDHAIPKSSDPAIGIDMGLTHLATLSNGNTINSPKHYVKAQKKLRVLQRSLARKTNKRSNSRKQARLRLSKHHEYIANCRKDFLHKATRNLVDKYGIIAMEKLSLTFMIKNKHLAKHASDVSLGQFTEMIKYKVEETGTQLIFVNPKYTSQICSQCGNIVKKELSQRTHICPCGLIIDRDKNAAINILQRGASLLDTLKYSKSGKALYHKPSALTDGS